MLLVLIIVIGMLGFIIGMMVWYFFGMWIGEVWLKCFVVCYGWLMVLLFLDIDNVWYWFDRYGGVVVFFGWMLFVICMLILVLVGLVWMLFGKFLVFIIVGSVIWISLLIFVGLILYENYMLVEGYIDLLFKLVIVIVVGVYLYCVIIWKLY